MNLKKKQKKIEEKKQWYRQQTANCQIEYSAKIVKQRTIPNIQSKQNCIDNNNNNNGANIIEENRIASTWLRLVALFPWIHHTKNKNCICRMKNKRKHEIESEIERDWESLSAAFRLTSYKCARNENEKT